MGAMETEMRPNNIPSGISFYLNSQAILPNHHIQSQKHAQETKTEILNQIHEVET